MCGLAGVARTDGALPQRELEREVALMAATLAARGPDGIGRHSRAGVALEFRRLAINDLPRGRQPFCSPDGAVVTAVNGEIFNHRELRADLGPDARWTSRNDCEVVRAGYERWGTAVVSRLRGMFAGVIVDHRRGEIVLFRDRFGVKPLFYATGPEGLLFASEVKALARHPRHTVAVDWTAALADPALNGVVAAPAGPPPSFFTGAVAVPPGCLVRYDLATGRLRTERYWDAADHFRATSSLSPADFVEQYRDTLIAATSEALMSDVPMGCFLSGGVDSVAIAALAQRVGASLECFSAVTDSTIANGDAAAARRAADELGLRLHSVDLQHWARRWTASSYLDLVAACETPLFGPEQVFKIGLHRHVRTRRPDIKVVLTGQGSDEFNGGYSSLFGADWDEAVAGIGVLADGRRRLAGPAAAWAERFGRSPLRDTGTAADDWQLYTLGKLRDLGTYNCWHEDRTAAYNSIENRVPFLDHRLVELGLGIPPDLRADLLWDKRILRDAVRPYLPAGLADRPKAPFFYGPGRASAFAPLRDALRADSGELFAYALGGAGAREHLDAGALEAILTGYDDDPELRDYEFFNRLVNLALLDRMLETESSLARAASTTLWSPPAYAAPIPVASQPILDVDAGYVLADGVECLTPVGAGTSWYFCVDGQIEYVLDDDAWLAVVRRLDGAHTLRAACAAADADLADIVPLAEQALAAGLVERIAVPLPLAVPSIPTLGAVS